MLMQFCIHPGVWAEKNLFVKKVEVTIETCQFRYQVFIDFDKF